MRALRICVPQPIIAIVRFSPGLSGLSPTLFVAHPASVIAAVLPKMNPRLLMFIPPP